ncbi:urease accessory protein UreD [Streptomyces sp. M2CJ-2]|uniref:urease accessory protein UreD n=1 Tax=Streptomyces sp. M2CJ-2 TaxID=2803948 RepID=UPI0019282D8F|nr:urease accessory protein UreD [Streptomyces sp. M2CJ-2]MBL3670847.1 urease accessory protein UreD [Streptomyces sp. M2CJ-2]
MKARAHLTVELDSRGRSVVRELTSASPLTLMPRRGAVRPAAGPTDRAVVHLVNSAISPLGGDELDLRVRVGAGARLLLRGVAATLVLPGHRRGGSRSTVHVEVAEGGTLEYLPEHTVVTACAEHEAEFRAELAQDALVRCREVLVLGRSGERPGSLRTSTHVTRGEAPLVRQTLELGNSRLEASAGYLAGARVVATESVVWKNDPVAPTSGEWWSLTPLAAGGATATALAPDAVTAQHRLTEALRTHPDGKELTEEHW